MPDETDSQDGGVERVENARRELDAVDWGEQPMSARRAADLADKALSNVAQEMKDAATQDTGL